LKAPEPARAYLDRAEQIGALLAAAGVMDAQARSNGRMARRALLSTLVFGGLRITEALDLRWRDVDLAASRLRVKESKTDAGVRYVDLLPIPHDELTEPKAGAGKRGHVPDDALVFPSATGTRQDRNRVRTRILAKAIKRANDTLREANLGPLPEGLTLHALRRTCASLRVAIGHDPAHVQYALGHSDPTVTLGIYAHVMRLGEEEREAPRQLVSGAHLAANGSGGENGSGIEGGGADTEAAETA
jgi:integrase